MDEAITDNIEDYFFLVQYSSVKDFFWQFYNLKSYSNSFIPYEFWSYLFAQHSAGKETVFFSLVAIALFVTNLAIFLYYILRAN